MYIFSQADFFSNGGDLFLFNLSRDEINKQLALIGSVFVTPLNANPNLKRFKRSETNNMWFFF